MSHLKALYMFVNPAADRAKHYAEMELPTSTIITVGVNSIDQGVELAKTMVDQGVVLIELCGGFGYEGASKVSAAVGDKAAVGVMVHQVQNAKLLATILAGR